MRNRISNLIWGLLFIVVGLGYAGDILGMWEFTLFFEGWWTLFIIIPCGISIIREGLRISSAIGFIIGVMLLTSYYITIDFNLWQMLIPVVLVLIGLRILFQGSFRRSFRSHQGVHMEGHTSTHTSSAPKGEYTAVFSSNHVRITETFTGTNLSAIFGALVLDLRDAVITGDVNINATAVFGGIDIYVPRNVIVKVNNVPIFGGVSNKTGYQADPGAPVIYLNSTCMFGGIDIK